MLILSSTSTIRFMVQNIPTVKAAFITQGGFKAYLSDTLGVITIESPNDFTPEQGKILAVFTIQNSQRSSIKTITVTKL